MKVMIEAFKNRPVVKWWVRNWQWNMEFLLKFGGAVGVIYVAHKGFTYDRELQLTKQKDEMNLAVFRELSSEVERAMGTVQNALQFVRINYVSLNAASGKFPGVEYLDSDEKSPSTFSGLFSARMELLAGVSKVTDACQKYAICFEDEMIFVEPYLTKLAMLDLTMDGYQLILTKYAAESKRKGLREEIQVAEEDMIRLQCICEDHVRQCQNLIAQFKDLQIEMQNTLLKDVFSGKEVKLRTIWREQAEVISSKNIGNNITKPTKSLHYNHGNES